MSRHETQDQSLDNVVAQLCALDGVAYEPADDGIRLTISYDGASREVFLATAVSTDDYRAQKIQYGDLCRTLSDLGVKEGDTFVAAAPPSSRPMTPQMLAAREERKAAFEAWQEVWRTIRKAEKALDVAYEITQMKDYY